MNNPNFELNLARNGSFSELSEFFKCSFFCDEAQEALVLRRDNQILAEYAKHFSFGKKAQILLVQTRNVEILLIQLQKHSLCLEAQRELVKMLK